VQLEPAAETLLDDTADERQPEPAGAPSCIAALLQAAAASVAPTSSQRWLAVTSSANPVSTTRIEAHPSQ
jgi:hypothetical protein